MRQIRIFTIYRSVSIPMLEPGIYAENDPRLKGRAEYLVENGHAKWVEAVVTVQEADAVLYGETEIDAPASFSRLVQNLDDMNRDELIAFAQQHDIPVDARWGIARLRDEIKDAFNA